MSVPAWAPYEVLASLGAGGMGEVYKARDTRLDRTVAIKVLPAHVASEPDVRQRFEREARAVAALNHPHICTLHDIGSQDGVDFLVMEYLEGQTLADKLAKGQLPLDQALRYGIQIADALDKAHRAGIVHRDLKPGNIMLTKAGAKLLDFGLAKTSAPVVAGTSLSMQPTTPPDLTAEGTILGTFQYMAPEQLEGQDADARTDIFAFGAVLYEMITGKKASEGKSQASLIAAIMSSQPSLVSTLQPLAPPALDRLVNTCLEKDPDNRWQNAGDLLRELRWVADACGEPIKTLPVLVRRNRRELVAWSAAAASLIAAIALGVLAYRQGTPTETPAYRTTILTPEVVITEPNPAGRFALSPDGRRLAFVARGADQRIQLWVRALDALTAQPLAGTDGAKSPFWSPDSRFIAFYAQGELRRIDATGGPPLKLTDATTDVLQTAGGTWNRDNIILFSPTPFGGLFRISASGGPSSPVTMLDTTTGERAPASVVPARWPSLCLRFPRHCDESNGHRRRLRGHARFDGAEADLRERLQHSVLAGLAHLCA